MATGSDDERERLLSTASGTGESEVGGLNESSSTGGSCLAAAGSTEDTTDTSSTDSVDAESCGGVWVVRANPIRATPLAARTAPDTARKRWRSPPNRRVLSPLIRPTVAEPSTSLEHSDSDGEKSGPAHEQNRVLSA